MTRQNYKIVDGDAILSTKKGLLAKQQPKDQHCERVRAEPVLV